VSSSDRDTNEASLKKNIKWHERTAISRRSGWNIQISKVRE